ncbi:hypothetical protein ACFWEJ_04580 [Promicromonospora sp. NPDC060204]|uniref:hypothetical protein n=1 Tax=Promicromonospora sp. NPDC060204 TaxID=3347071 RepID=UPI003659DD19
MDDKLTFAAVLLGGYLLGRTKKLKLALAVAGALGVRELRAHPDLLKASGAALSTPAIKKLTDEVSGRLVEAGKTAVVAAAAKRVDSLVSNLEERAGAPLASHGGEQPADEETGDEPAPEDEASPEEATAGSRSGDDEPEDEQKQADDEQADDEQATPKSAGRRRRAASESSSRTSGQGRSKQGASAGGAKKSTGTRSTTRSTSGKSTRKPSSR